MYGTPLIQNTLSFGKILGGLSKTLSIANQVIPLYQQAKPLINNFGSVMNVLKSFSSSNTSENKTTTNVKNVNKEKVIETKSITNPPTFFI